MKNRPLVLSPFIMNLYTSGVVTGDQAILLAAIEELSEEPGGLIWATTVKELSDKTGRAPENTIKNLKKLARTGIIDLHCSQEVSEPWHSFSLIITPDVIKTFYRM